MESRREYIIKQLMVEDFIEISEKQEVLLEETDKDGESELKFITNGNNVLIIKNIDKKKTELYFFRNNKELCLFKRVDHIILDYIADNEWNVYLIEMKSSIKENKWIEVKGKFRVSYLIIEAICAMLSIKIKDVYMFTTYEKVDLSSSTIPTAHRTNTGKKIIPFDKEWSGEDFGIDLGERILFKHIPIHMQKDDSRNVLIGEYNVKDDFSEI